MCRKTTTTNNSVHEEINLQLTIPTGFAATCKTFGIDTQTALQGFIDQLLVYAYFTTPLKASNYGAPSVLNRFLDARGCMPPPDANRETHIRYTQQLLELIRTNMKTAKKEKLYHALIDEWYAALQP